MHCGALPQSVRNVTVLYRVWRKVSLCVWLVLRRTEYRPTITAKETAKGAYVSPSLTPCSLTVLLLQSLPAQRNLDTNR